MTEATIKVHVGGHRYIATAEGNGPVNALDKALRIAIGRFYPAPRRRSSSRTTRCACSTRRRAPARSRACSSSPATARRAGARSASRRTSSRRRGRRSSTRSSTASRTARRHGRGVAPRPWQAPEHSVPPFTETRREAGMRATLDGNKTHDKTRSSAIRERWHARRSSASRWRLPLRTGRRRHRSRSSPTSRSRRGSRRASSRSSDAQLLCPVAPTKVVCVGLNYRKHIAEMGHETPLEPVIFIKPSTAVIGPGSTSRSPPASGGSTTRASWAW